MKREDPNKNSSKLSHGRPGVCLVGRLGKIFQEGIAYAKLKFPDVFEDLQTGPCTFNLEGRAAGCDVLETVGMK